jgi:hypothetical protein
MSKRTVLPSPAKPLALAAAHGLLMEAYRSMGHSSNLGHLLGPLRYAFSDVEMFAEVIAGKVVRVDPRPHAMFDALEPAAKASAHDAYVSVIAVGQGLLALEHDEIRADKRAFDICLHAVDQALDALAPYVSRADLDVRRMLLDDEPLDDPASGAQVH